MSRLALLLCFVLGFVLTSCHEETRHEPTLEATASATTLAPGQTANLVVTRQYAGGPIEDVTGAVAYTVTPPDALSLDRSGVVTPGTQVGNALLRLYDRESNAKTSVLFEVLGTNLVTLRIDPTPTAALAPGQTRLFRALATFSDRTERDVTTTVQWASSNERAASVGRSQGSFGVVTALAAGETTITALDVTSNTEARTVVIVSGAAPTLLAIRVTPNPATVAVGAPVPFVATGVYANGTTADVTRAVQWSSSDAANATVDANGVAVGVALGDVTISAADSASGVRGSSALNVQ